VKKQKAGVRAPALLAHRAGAPSEVDPGLFLWSTSGSVPYRQRPGNVLPSCIGVEIVRAAKTDSPCATLGRPLVSPGFAGSQVAADPGQRMACQRGVAGESVQRVHGRDQTPAPIEKQLRLRRLTV
jgi:hypothetical protein